MNQEIIVTALTVGLPTLAALAGTIIANVSMGKQHTLNLMRLQVLSTELSVSIRLGIYDEYKKRGGNSWLDEYVDTVLKPMAKGQFVDRQRRKDDAK